jgi:hypothetical protein
MNALGERSYTFLLLYVGCCIECWAEWRISKSFKNRQSTWGQLANDFGRQCHPDTVKHAMEDEGYHKCKACQMTWLSDDKIKN